AATLGFFSSRRRHTRFSRDWSSDVCSSDLLRGKQRELGCAKNRSRRQQDGAGRHVFGSGPNELSRHRGLEKAHTLVGLGAVLLRSEERRVGTEWTPWRLACHQKESRTISFA